MPSKDFDSREREPEWEPALEPKPERENPP